jgi:hypothetical protein
MRLGRGRLTGPPGGIPKADQGLAAAQDNLGFCYHNGTGLAKDEAEAVKWFRKAAEQNYPPAQHNLGVCYAQGTGVGKDPEEAGSGTARIPGAAGISPLLSAPGARKRFLAPGAPVFRYPASAHGSSSSGR